MYHGKTTPELEQLSEEYYKMFAEKEWGRMENHDICLDTSSFGYEGNDYKAYVKDIKKALKIKKELPDFVE